MANTFQLTTWMAKEFLRHFENNCVMPKFVNKHYVKDFTSEMFRPGTTINIPKPARFTAASGATATFPDLTEDSVSLTVQQWNTSFAPTSLQMTTEVQRDQWSERYIRPMAIALANQVDVGAFLAALTGIANAVGTPGTTPNTLKTYLDAKAVMSELACPQDDKLSIVINPAAQASIVDALKGLFQSAEDIADQYRKGTMGLAIGARWSMDQNIQARTVGTQGGTPLINGASQTGSTLATDGWSASITNVLRAGDLFTIDGVYSVNPISKSSTGRLQTFVVTANASSTAGGAVAALAIFPPIVTSGTTQNVTNSPADNAAINVLGASGVTAMDNLAFHEDAFTFACIPMVTYGGLDKSAVEYDPDTGIAVRMTQGMDVTNDKLLVRADVLFGWAVTRPEWACRVAG